ncbi:hypothetical protein ACFVWG_01350 [Kribbella sp. NPDC058245]|uniref:hypothetical protein n=1 Tax=Kribbella sp. NPDC058245 TaxID=3346399 RepID=UPI0036E76B12
MTLRRTLALAATTLLLLSGGVAEATAVLYPVVQAADDDADDLDVSTPTAPSLATSSTPSAFDTSATSPVDHCILWSETLGNTCFEWVGDIQWVQDNIENGWATVVNVQTNYGKDRYCQAPPKAKGWGYCDYDHKEGKCVRWRFYELKDGTTRNWGYWSAWYGTAYGYPC